MDCDPELARVIQNFEDIDRLKYAAYRAALKIQRIQKLCKLDIVDLNMVSSVLGNINQKENFASLTLEKAQFLLFRVYDATKGRDKFSGDHFSHAQIVISLLRAVFCGYSGDVLTLFHLKAVLVVLCAAKIMDKYKYIVRLCSTGHSITKGRLMFALNCFAKVFELLGEKLSFGSHLVPSAVASCMHFCHEYEKISEDNFLQWLSCEPQTLVWISTHYRLSVAENIKHNVKCSVCKACPFVGLRYKCSQCFNYNLCQQCFLLGFVTKSHKATHPVQEFCQKASKWMEPKMIFSAIKNRFQFINKNKSSYLPYDNEGAELESNHQEEPDSVSFSFGTFCSGIVKELTSILEKMEEENRQMCLEIMKMQSEFKLVENVPCEKSVMVGMLVERQEVLQDHRCHLQLQLPRLRNLVLGLNEAMNTKQLKQEICLSPKPNSPATKVNDIYKSTSVMNVNGYYESTPVMVANGQPFFPPNLSDSLHQQSDIEKLMTVPRHASNYCQTGHLYSVADIDITVPDWKKPSGMSTFDNTKTKSVNSLLSTQDKSRMCDSSICLSNYKNAVQSPMSVPEIVESRRAAVIQDQYSQSLKNLTSGINSAPMFGRIHVPEVSVEMNSLIDDVECELQTILDQLQDFYPKMAGLQTCASIEKNKILHALSEMEDALKKLSTSAASNIMSISSL